MDPLTGRAVVNFPIGSISAQDISIGASLSHHGGALKVNESPGNAGMGWQVYAGGSVSREVRGLPDDFSKANDPRTGWLVNSNANALMVQSFTSASDNNLDVCSDEVADWNFLNGLNYLKDTEPDIFYFSAPGLSGKFVFGSDGQPKLVPYQDLAITYTLVPNSSKIESFTIKTSTGLVYTFGNVTSMVRQAYGTSSTTNNLLYQTAASFSISWNLTSLESKATGAIANLSYIATPKIFTTSFSSVSDPAHVNVAVDTLNKIKDAVAPSRLSQVTLKNYSMNLVWANNLIDKVTVSESESGIVQEFDLTYQAVTSAGDTGMPKVSRPFLVEIKQQNPATCEALPSYRFEYTSVDLSSSVAADISWRTGYGEDFFGYFNGATGSPNVTGLYFYSGESDGRRYRVTPIPGGNPQVLNPPPNGTMSVNPTYTAFGSLKKIVLPTGGTVEYGYEANRYWDATTNEEFNGPGVRVANITTSGGEYAFGKFNTAKGYHKIVTNYSYVSSQGGTQTSGKLTFPPAFGYTRGTTVLRTQSDWTEGTQLYYGRVTESVQGQGWREYTFDLPNMYPDPAATISKVARAPGSTCTGTLFKNGAYGLPFAPLKDFGYLRGLPLSVVEYDNNNNKTLERISTYATVAGVVVKGLRYEWLTNSVFNFSLYEIPVNESRLLVQEEVRNYSEEAAGQFISTVTTFNYNSKNLLKQSTQTNADGSIVKKFFVYASDFAGITSPVDQQAVAINKLNTTYNRASTVVETYQTLKPAGGIENVVGGQLTLYKDYSTYAAPVQSLGLTQEQIAPPGSGVLSTATASNFLPHPNYKIKGTVADWVNGVPVNQTNPYNNISSGVHFVTGTGMALATFANAKAEHAVYEGFEFVQARGLTYAGAGVALLSSGRAGKRSLQIGTANATVANTSAIIKKENSYRISAWVFGGNSATLTVQAMNGAVPVGTAALSYTTPGQWKYLETVMDMTNVPASFGLQLSVNATLQVDDFVAMPKSARVSYSSAQPFVGVTDQVDDRGNSAKGEFDTFARPTKTYDRKGNLREVREYGTQRSSRVELNANFVTSLSQYNVGQSATFTAPTQATCLATITYNWEARAPDGSLVTSTGTTFNYTFPYVGFFSVKLTVSSSVAGYSSVNYTENICVTFPENFAATIVVGNGATTIYKCDPNDGPNRTFSVSFTGVDPAVSNNWSYNCLYTWYITDALGQWQVAENLYGAVTSGKLLTYNTPQNSYQVTCVVTVRSGYNYYVSNSDCNQQYATVSPSAPTSITYINNGPCQ
ncbi:MAG: PKD domain-containing protein [Cytophagales bacterium]|nr:PKD domain-containing protein [Cytophagales bacterium]